MRAIVVNELGGPEVRTLLEADVLTQPEERLDRRDRVAKRAGARVLGTVSSAVKAEAVRAVGGETLEYGDDLARRVFEATDGRGVDVVLDSVGRATQDVSLEKSWPGSAFFCSMATQADRRSPSILTGCMSGL